MKIRIKFKSYDHRLLDTTIKEIVDALKTHGCEVKGPIPLPTKRSIYPVLRSTFVHKKSFEHFELRIHKRIIEIVDPKREIREILEHRIKVPAGVYVEMKTI